MVKRWTAGLLAFALHVALAEAKAPDDTCAEQVLYAGHTHAITAAVFASSGRTLVTASIQKGPEGNVVLWDAASGKRQGQLDGHANGVYALAASHNGKWLASGGDGLVLVHALNGGQELARFTSCKGRVLALAFSPNDQTLAAAGEDRSLHLLDLSRQVERAACPGHQDMVTSLAYGPDGLKFASGSYDGSVKIWNSASGTLEKTLTANGGRIHGVAFAQDGKHLAAACAVGPEQEGERFSESSRAQVALWDLDNPRDHKSLLGANKTFTAVCFLGAQPILAASTSEGTLRTWDLDGKPLGAVRAHEAWITSLAYAPGAGSLLTTSWDCTARLWDLPRWKLLGAYPEVAGPPQELVCEPRSSLLIGGCGDKSIRFWEPVGMKMVRQIQSRGDPVGAVAVSPDGVWLAAAASKADESSKACPIILWNLRTGKEERTFEGHTGLVPALAFSPDGRLLASGGHDKTVRLWNVATGQEQMQLLGHGDAVSRVAFLPEGKTLASAARDGTIRFWDLRTGLEKKSLQTPNRLIGGMAFSPDGATLATCDSNQSSFASSSVICWDVESGEKRWVADKADGRAATLAFSLDGKLLAVGGAANGRTRSQRAGTGFIRVFESRRGREKLTLMRAEHPVASLCFAGHGKMLVTAGASKEGKGEVLVWAVP